MSMIKIKIDILEAMISFVSNIDEKTMLKQKANLKHKYKVLISGKTSKKQESTTTMGLKILCYLYTLITLCAYHLCIYLLHLFRLYILFGL